MADIGKWFRHVERPDERRTVCRRDDVGANVTGDIGLNGVAFASRRMAAAAVSAPRLSPHSATPSSGANHGSAGPATMPMTTAQISTSGVDRAAGHVEVQQRRGVLGQHAGVARNGERWA
jgi:hypothetical protein